MNILLLTRYLVEKNRDMVQHTAIKNCHAIGLHSFIINESPKIRLYIADESCELRGQYIVSNPIIPIHAHKYDDLFYPLYGKLIHHMYELDGLRIFKKYEYLRLSDKEKQIVYKGTVQLAYLGAYEKTHLKANELHSVHVIGDKCAWLIVELEEDKSFKQVAYHQNLVERPELYQALPNAVEYIINYIT